MLIAAMVIYGLLLRRFIHAIIRARALPNSEINALSQLLVSGSGGIGTQFRAFVYLARGEYQDVHNEVVVSAGRHARASLFCALTIMLACSVAFVLGK